MASPTRWTWVWASSRCWWWTGKPGMLESMGSQRVRHTWATELNLDNNVFHSISETVSKNNEKFACCCSVGQSCPTLCDPMDCSTPGFLVHHQLPEFTQTHVHWVGDVIQPSHPLSLPSPPALNLSQHQGLFQWVGSLHQVPTELPLQHQSFQWKFRFAFLQDWLV